MNVSEVIILDEAAEDLGAAQCFYNEREFGVGSYFIDTLLSDIESLLIFAGIHNIHYGYMRALSKRFPFAIYYDIEDDSARVVAVFDMRQDPETIRKCHLRWRRTSKHKPAGMFIEFFSKSDG